MHCLGILYADKGKVDEAIALYNQSLEINERIGNVQGKAATLHQLGILYANKGEIDQAIALYNQSLEINEHIGNVQGKAVTLHNLAGIYAKKGDVDEAIALFNQSLEILNALEMFNAKRRICTNWQVSTPTKGKWMKRSHFSISL
ncbi:tetratricopeptide repeat protein [Nostoc sp. TCL240-02]|nr:tetratricopeptide repeat protein [Nostoc sp. TCL240-02]QKQ73103.1 tetratricopeptide repeat protein [Nostoc sp. TCL240-02]